MTSELATAFVRQNMHMTVTCSLDGCGKPARMRADCEMPGICKYHFQRWRLRETMCTVEDCGKPQFARGYCQLHYWRQRRTGSITGDRRRTQELACTVDGCDGKPAGRSLCNKHYLKWYLAQNPPDPEAQRRRSRKHWLKKYGLTQDSYDRMIKEQGGGCAICHTGNPGPRSWLVDHDHETGEVRGLLCRNCNSALGMLGDSIDTAWALIEYLLAHQPERESRAGVI